LKILSSNKKAYFDYEILDKYEAGIALLGWEVKSIKNTNFNITNAYIVPRDNELLLVGMRVGILPGSFEQDKNKEIKDRKLLLKKSEIFAIMSKVKSKGLTMVPLEVYQNDRGLIKVALAIVRGKKKYQKKDKIKERDQIRSIEIDRKSFNV
jgi:SsrA-binding protein